MIFTSNDRKPNKWFRNRSKMLSLDVMFDSTPQAEAEVQTIIQTDSPLFDWIAHSLLTGYQTGSLDMDADVLSPVRSILFDLYDHANRPVPAYLNDEPAETRYDPGRRKWRRMAADNQFTMTRKQDNLHLTFDDDVRPWKIAEFRRHLPANARAEQEGHSIIVRSPDHFEEWLGEIDTGGVLDRIRSLFR